MKKHWIALSILVAVVAVVAIAAYNYTVANRLADNGAIAPNQPSSSASAEPPRPAAPQSPAQDQPNAGFPFQDTSMLKPPAGAQVAIYEFEDLECPACAHASPIVHAAAARYKIPLERHDYPWSFHVWSLDAAVTARYIQDKLSPQLADNFRQDVFANQTLIESKDDLVRFTAKWFQSHGQTLPFVMDASGACRNEVESDRALGDRLGVHSTPCIFVVTQSKWVPIVDLNQLDRILDEALAQTSGQSAAASAGPIASPFEATARS
jgi:protein-disulfide isomerase